MEKITKKVRFG